MQTAYSFKSVVVALYLDSGLICANDIMSSSDHCSSETSCGASAGYASLSAAASSAGHQEEIASTSTLLKQFFICTILDLSLQLGTLERTLCLEVGKKEGGL